MMVKVLLADTEWNFAKRFPVRLRKESLVFGLDDRYGGRNREACLCLLEKWCWKGLGLLKQITIET